MTGFLPLIETAVAFSAAMLAASLFVSALVQLIQGVGRYRSQTMTGMLRATIHGFRVQHGDAEAMAADRPHADAATRARCDRVERAFVADVLAEPVLHARDTRLALQDDPEQLAAQVEYLHGEDLVAIATARARRCAAPGASTLLPAAWVGEAAVSDPARSYATVDNFRSYVERWFPVIEGTAAQHFKMRIRRLTLVLSCLLAVLFNLDGIHLIAALYRSDSGRAELARQVTELQTVATRLGVAGSPSATTLPVDRRDQDARELALELQKTASILDEAQVGLGWRESWIGDRWCAWHPACVTAGSRSTLAEALLDTLLWLAGIAFGCAMLSLGAPFWVTTLSRLINLRNEVQARRREPASGATTGARLPPGSDGAEPPAPGVDSAG